MSDSVKVSQEECLDNNIKGDNYYNNELNKRKGKQKNNNKKKNCIKQAHKTNTINTTTLRK